VILVRWALWVMAASLLIGEAALGQVRVVNPLSADATETFYHLPEGGAVMPLAWYRSLNVIDSTTGQSTGQTFAEQMDDYGFLDDAGSDYPVGFGVVSLDFLGGVRGLSINCAACHVGELRYQSTRLRINGGPNLADVRRFSQDVYQSGLSLVESPGRLLPFLLRSGRLQADTVAKLDDPAFVASVERQMRRSHDGAPLLSGSSAGLMDVDRNLRLIFAELNYFTAQGRMPLTTHEGFGRLDAFATVRFLLFPEDSAVPFTAPVSVPHLWGIEQKKWLHWNNNTNSTLERNIAQALGMGAVQAKGGIHDVLLPNLDALETIAHQIAPPQLPMDVFGPLRDDLVERGAALYEVRCAGCHDAGRTDPASGLIEYPMFSLAEVRTDPNHALNFHQPVGGQPFATALGDRLRSLEQWSFNRSDPRHPVPVATRVQWSGGGARLPAVWRDPLTAGTEATVYSALPLVGVWATAPYLHNNSVPTLRDLLKPASERPTVFQVGPRNYDPADVGYAQPAGLEDISRRFRFDTRESGNANTGHDGPAFGAADLSSEDVEALLEYLKSL
jgi:mono/diheme cytochrome c family protein